MWYDSILHENGYCVCEKHWGLKQELVGFHRVYYVKGGTCSYTSKSSSFLLKKEHLYVFPTFHEYDMSHDPLNPLDVLWFHIQIFPDIQNDVLDINTASSPIILSLLHSLHCIINDRHANEEKSVLIDLLLHYIEQQIGFDRVTDKRFSDLMQFIRNNLHGDLSIQTLANVASMERSYFSRLFKRTYGVSPQEYVIAVRMVRAMQLLKTDSSIAQISEHVGYESEKAFSTMFAKHSGFPPSIFRKSHIRKP